MKITTTGVGNQLELLIFTVALVTGIMLILLLHFTMYYIGVELGIITMWLLSIIIMVICYLGGLYVLDKITYIKTCKICVDVMLNDVYQRLQTIEILLRELIYEINNYELKNDM